MRHYSFGEPCDTGDIHALGNGRMLVYGQGPELHSVFGPGYSAPSFGDLLPIFSEKAEAVSHRLPGTNTWEHTVSEKGRTAAVMTDAMDPEQCLFVRNIRSESSFAIRWEPGEKVQSRFLSDYPLGAEKKDVLCLTLPKHTPFFVGDVTEEEKQLLLFGTGCVRATATGAAVTPGEGRLVLAAFSPAHPDLLSLCTTLCEGVRERSERDWAAFFGEGKPVRDSVPSDSPFAGALIEALYDIPALIRSQTSAEGGVIAGHFYPMAYVRDQAGTLRGLLRMGYLSLAEGILRFWWNKYRCFGFLANAECTDLSGRLIFSNDEVETPAYIVRSAFDYADAAGDRSLLWEMKPMLEWAVKAQLKHLVGGMTGFSGDETYVAGNFFPRAFLYHGSCESTALFILSSERYLREFGPIKGLEEGIRSARENFRRNFVRDGMIYANCPEREKLLPPPRFHFGYCARCFALRQPTPLSELEYDPISKMHVCPDCFGKSLENPPENRPYVLGTVTLLRELVDGGLVTEEEYRQSALTFELDPHGATGYDYALRLRARLRAGLPFEQQLREMLEVRDETGAWCEYYREGKPYNCRCRPWESALNLEAALEAVLPTGRDAGC